MDIRKLDYFLKVCESGSFSAAASRYFISQQALSKSIDLLESELGLTLFVRTNRGLQLTEFGERLREEGLALVQHQERVDQFVLDMKGSCRAGVSLSFYLGMLTQYPAGFLDSYILAHPDVSFHLFGYSDDAHGRKYANTGTDVFISTVPMLLTDMELAYHIKRPLGILIGENHPLAKRSSLELRELQGETVFAITSDNEAQNALQKVLQSSGICFSCFLSDAETDFTYNLVRAGHAVSFFAGPQCMLPGGTVCIPLNEPAIFWHGYFYIRKQNDNQASRELLDYFVNHWEKNG